jgi:ATP-binding cassette, subfamily B, bacterial HlyB/CyaB
MNEEAWRANAIPEFNGGFQAVTVIARIHGVEATALQIAHQMALGRTPPAGDDLVRAAQLIGLKARRIKNPSPGRLRRAPVPAIVRLHDGTWWIYRGETTEGEYRLVDPLSKEVENVSMEGLQERIAGDLILVGKGVKMSASDLAFGVSWFLPMMRRYRGPLIQVMVVSFFVNLLALSMPLCFQLVVDKVLAYRSYSTLVVVILAMLILAVFGAMLKHLRQHIIQHTANRIDVELGARMFGHLLHLPLSYFEIRAAGVIVTRARELRTVRQFLTGQALITIIDLMFIFIFLAVLFIYSKILAAMVLLILPLYVAIGALLRPALKRLLKQKFKRWSAGQQLMVESIIGIQTLKAAAVEPLFMRKWEERLAAFVKVSFDAAMVGVLATSGVGLVSQIQTAAVLFFGTLQVLKGSLTVGGLIAFMLISRQLAAPILRMAQVWQDFQSALVAIDHLADIFDSPVESLGQSSSAPAELSGQIEFRNVSFGYRTELPDAVKNLSLKIRPGEVIGIVGPSGSGKSTLTKLLQRLYEPRSGEILLDGHDIMQLDPSWLRRQLGVVLQENILFNQTVRENIAMARPDMPRSAVLRVARLAGADEFISKLPQGYDTVIEERGANLSGGQRQRLAIARALATNPRILILDEATSALDYESERIIQGNMERIVRGRTVIIIAHRLAAVRGCDRIVGMYDGEIIEMGTHDELIHRRSGLYAHLWALQNDHLS